MKYTPTEIIKDVPSFFSMLWAILRGKYKMPWGTLGMAVLCLIYLLSPVDIVPDVLPILGVTDDGTFILLVLAMLHNNLLDYRKAQKEQQAALPPADKPAQTHNFAEDLKK